MKKLRTAAEEEVGKNIAHIFSNCPDQLEIKIQNFPKYARRQYLKRFLSMYEIFKLILPVKGSIVECGIYQGFSLMSWAKLSTILEPENLTRRIYGFDTFQGFPSISDKDQNRLAVHKKGDLDGGSYEELQQLITEYDRDRFLGHINKVQLVKGDVLQTIPQFISENRHLLVSLLFIDLDLFEPTKAAIENFLPRMPKGAIIAFDDLDNPLWPGETLALLETVGLKNLELRRLEWDPYIGFGILG
ncbi:MAG: class I SAM-dependent methyltransferase [Deltaproteobacteria bacterium]|nr:class I SAM-dependent methyltransferase [Deltaproteobacteria bacterium]